MSDAGHRQVEHTADLAFELWGPTHEAVLQQGARALVEVLTGGAAPSGAEQRTVSIEVVDEADRLVRWLNEVLYLALVEGFVVADAQLDLSAAGQLTATVSGDTSVALQTEIKSATYHDLQITRDGPRLRAVVVLDV